MTSRTHQYPQFERLVKVMQAQGIDIITSNVEHGPGQVEINYTANVGMLRTKLSCSRIRLRNI